MRGDRRGGVALALLLVACFAAACVTDPLIASGDLLPVDQSTGFGDQLASDADASLVDASTLLDLAIGDLGDSDLVTPPDLGLLPAAWSKSGQGLVGGDIKKVTCPETNHCFAATGRSIYESTDGGLAWLAIAPQPMLALDESITTMVALPPDGGELIVLSTARTWRRPNGLPTTDFIDEGAVPGAFADAVAVASTLVARLSTDELYERTANSTWTAISSPTTNTAVKALAASPGTLELWVGANDGVWRRDLASTDMASPGWQHVFVAPTTTAVSFDVSTSPPGWVARDGSDLWLSPMGTSKCVYNEPMAGSFFLERLIVRLDSGYVDLNPSTCKSVPLDVNPNSKATSFVRVPSASTTLLAYGERGLFRIAATIVRSESGLEAAHITALASPSNVAGALWVATTSGLFRRASAGDSFVEVATPLKPFHPFAGVAAIGQHVVATATGSELVYSGDGGTTWGVATITPSDLGSPSAMLGAGPVAMIGDGSVVMACGADGKTYASADGGMSFTLASTSVVDPLEECVAVVRHPTNNTFYLAADKTVWRGTAGGAPWTRLYDSQLAGIVSVSPDPQDTDAAYVVASGVFRFQGAVAGIVNNPEFKSPHQVITDGTNLYVVDAEGALRQPPAEGWRRLGSGYPVGSVATTLLPTAADPNAPLYLGTAESGLLSASGVWSQ